VTSALPDGWRICTILDLAPNGIAGGPFRSSLGRKDYVASGVPVIRGSNLSDPPDFGDGSFVWVSEDKADELARNLAVPGDIVLTQRGTLGQIARVPYGRYPRFVISQSQMRVRPAPDLADPGYVLLAMRSPHFVSQIHRHAIATGVPHINLGILNTLTVPLPSLPEQRAIAGVLGALDDKIESNRRLCGTIDELLPLLISVNRSGESRSKVKLGDLVHLRKGVSYRRAELQPSSTAMVSLKCVGRTGEFQPEGLKEYVGTPKPDQVVRPGELVVAQTDLTQGAEVVGRVLRVPSGTGYLQLVASLDLVIVRPIDVDPDYLYLVLLQAKFRQHCQARTSGTTVLHLASDALPTFEFDLDPPEIQREVSRTARPLLAKRDRANAESRTLAELRDALLPELLSGRLRVPVAEEIVESAT